MAMRAQVYEFTNAGVAILAGTQQSIFLPATAGLPRLNETIKAGATDFIVIEEVGASPWLVGATNAASNAFLQIRIGTTDYFKRPDNTASPGIPSFAIPYPRGSVNQLALTAPSIYLDKIFDLIPDIYVLPGQVWDIILTNGTAVAAGDDFRVYVKYTLYDGADAAIATKLLEAGVAVNPTNVDWYKRMLIEGKVTA